MFLYSSNDELLADELKHLFKVFVENGYPEKLVQRILHEDIKTKDALGEQSEKSIDRDFGKCFYVPYHPRARRLYQMLEKEFGFLSPIKGL